METNSSLIVLNQGYRANAASASSWALSILVGLSKRGGVSRYHDAFAIGLFRASFLDFFVHFRLMATADIRINSWFFGSSSKGTTPSHTLMHLVRWISLSIMCLYLVVVSIAYSAYDHYVVHLHVKISKTKARKPTLTLAFSKVVVALNFTQFLSSLCRNFVLSGAKQ